LPLLKFKRLNLEFITVTPKYAPELLNSDK